jgi:cysteinyl-tRNA synthetase
VVLAHDLITKVPGEAIRWALLSGHYRQPLDWTGDLLEQARKSLDRLYGALRRTKDLPVHDGFGPPKDFVDALMSDLNTPAAFADLFEVAGAIERALNEGDLDTAAKGKSRLLAAGAIIGFLQADPEHWFQGGADEALVSKVEGLLAERVAARAAKDWPTADRIRAELDALNVVVMDNPNGATWRLK